jgi:succinate-acetate transporter protein
MSHSVLKVPLASNLDMALRTLDIVIAIGRYILPMTIAFALLSVAAAINSFATGSIAGTGFWGVLAFMGAVFAGQIIAKRRRSRMARPRKIEHRSKYADAAQA